MPDKDEPPFIFVQMHGQGVTSRRDKYAVCFSHPGELVYLDLTTRSRVRIPCLRRDNRSVIIDRSQLPETATKEVLDRIIAAGDWYKAPVKLTGRKSSGKRNRAA